MSNFRIRNLTTRGVEQGTPSPMLISAGGGEAYESMPGFWRLRDDKYDPEGTVYTRVSIEHTEDWRVDVTITPIGPDGAEPADDDYFIVVAATESEAFRLAEEAARDYVENMFGDEYGSDVTIIRARRGVSI
jgi:hypothetical protein